MSECDAITRSVCRRCGEAIYAGPDDPIWLHVDGDRMYCRS